MIEDVVPSAADRGATPWPLSYGAGKRSQRFSGPATRFPHGSRIGTQQLLAAGAVVDHEEQYSIWPLGLARRPTDPGGGTAVGFRGSESAALDHVAEAWSDITPLSVRRATAASRERPRG
jgi:MbtH protein